MLKKSTRILMQVSLLVPFEFLSPSHWPKTLSGPSNPQCTINERFSYIKCHGALDKIETYKKLTKD